VTLAERLPSSGRYSIPRLIMLAVSTGISLPQIAADLPALAWLGILGPSPDETYVGIPWSMLSRAV
jgi:hypothetical protein